MDALALLKQDHDEVRSLFEELDASNRRSLRARERLFEAIRTELDVHTSIEEDVLYPALRESPSETLRRSAVESLDEHRFVKDLLEDLEELSPSDEEFAATIAVLRDAVLRHAETEERLVFPEMRNVFETERLSRLGRELAERKQVLLSQPTYR